MAFRRARKRRCGKFNGVGEYAQYFSNVSMRICPKTRSEIPTVGSLCALWEIDQFRSLSQKGRVSVRVLRNV